MRGCLKLIGLVALAALSWASWCVACPFCSAPSLTLSEQFAQSDAVVLMKWVGGREATGQDLGLTEFEIVEVAKQPEGYALAEGRRLSLERYRMGVGTHLYLGLATKGETNLDWGAPIDVSPELWNYIRQAPNPEKPPVERLRYFMGFLEHAEAAIAVDAYGEFANAKYGDITPLASELPHEKLRALLFGAETPANRLGLYGLLVGLCGDTSDAAPMEAMIRNAKEEFRLGIDGVMGGYLLLTQDRGLDVLDETKLRAKDAPFSETYAAMQAIRFMWNYGDGKIDAERLKASMRLLLDRPELADLVIADLARWKDWSIQERLMTMYGVGEFDIPSIKRAIIRYMLVSVKDKATDGTVAEHVTRGQTYLEELEQRDAKTVAEAKRFFLFK